MIKSSYQKTLGAINRRLVDLRNTFGADDVTYINMANYLENAADVHGIKINITKDGVPQLSVSKKFEKINENEISKLKEYKTTGQKIATAKEQIKKDTGKKATRKQAIQYTQDTSKIKLWIQENADKIYRYVETNQAVRKKTFDNKARLTVKEVEILKKLIENNDTRGLTELDILATE